jgi:GDSL-like Lipase/Acylhydrolase family
VLRFLAGSIAIALTPFVLFFALCSFVSSHPSAAWLSERLAKNAYYGRADHFQADCTRYDARVTYLLRPCGFDGVEFSTEINTNSFGLRDDEASLIQPEIIVLGDSNAMGHGVEDKEAFPQVLERLLGRKVLNAGVSSFGTARELMLLRLLDTSAARTIVIQYCDNDFEENQALLQHGTLPIRSEREYAALVEKASASYLDLLGPGIRILRKAVDRLSHHEPFPEGVNRNEVQAEAFRDVLVKSMDLLRGRHVVILRLNGFGLINPQFINAARTRTAGLGLDLTFVDISTVLTRQDFFVLDPHMHPSGHQKVAALLAGIIGGRKAVSKVEDRSNLLSDFSR